MSRRPAKFAAFTLIELLVVIAIVGILMTLLLPAVMAVRHSALRTQCQSNFKQIGMAMLNYAETVGVLPPATVMRRNPNDPTKYLLNMWSAQARILPYMERGSQYEMFNFDVSYDFADPVTKVPVNGTAVGMIISVFTCPADIHQGRHRTGQGQQSINYAVNRGDWYVWGGLPVTENPSDPNWRFIPEPTGPFGVNSSVGMKDIRDGVSKTVLMAEVKTWMNYYRKCKDLTYAPIDINKAMPLPTDSPETISQYKGCSGGEFKDSLHTEFSDGGVHQTGFTTAWPPNKRTGGVNGTASYADLDVVGVRERDGGATFAAVTARSHHRGGVHAFFADGSVQFISNGIDGMIWRHLGTIDGGEVVSGDY